MAIKCNFCPKTIEAPLWPDEKETAWMGSDSRSADYRGVKALQALMKALGLGGLMARRGESKEGG
jgi:hypothetical protein